MKKLNMSFLKFGCAILLLLVLNTIHYCDGEEDDLKVYSRSFLDLFGLSERVVGGTAVTDGMFPWIVFIQANHKYKNKTQTSNLCGGSLIHSR